MKKIKLDIIGMSYSQSQSGAYALILGEVDGERRLPIIIGGFEAQAIAIELEKMQPTRPLTHDLFKRFANAYNILIKEVIINKFSEGVFFSELVCNDGTGEKVIDSRTSDAVALALRFNCPIYTYESIMAVAGVVMDEETSEEKAKESTDEISEEEYSKYTMVELKKMLEKAVENEEYEKASLIRDEMNRRE
jgi:bifunctional DNase/RNase